MGLDYIVAVILAAAVGSLISWLFMFSVNPTENEAEKRIKRNVRFRPSGTKRGRRMHVGGC